MRCTPPIEVAAAALADMLIALTILPVVPLERRAFLFWCQRKRGLGNSVIGVRFRLHHYPRAQYFWHGPQKSTSKETTNGPKGSLFYWSE